jgi:flagellar biosynthesis/type III secretory pathway M-ring protein FliF/YscJ
VAVLLDVPMLNGARSPRPDEEIDRIKRLVASAAGIRADRKDELEVLQVPFDPTAIGPGEATPQPAPAARPVRLPWSWTVGVAVAAAVLLLAALLVWRVRRRHRALVGAVSAALANDAEAEGEPTDHVAPPEVSATPVPIVPFDLKPKSDKDALRERIVAAAREHPGEMANVLRAWMVRRRASTS